MRRGLVPLSERRVRLLVVVRAAAWRDPLHYLTDRCYDLLLREGEPAPTGDIGRCVFQIAPPVAEDRSSLHCQLNYINYCIRIGGHDALLSAFVDQE
jgi:hypothetical protein